MNETKMRALVAVAYSDGYFDSRELFLINQRAKELGLDNKTILEIIRSPEKENPVLPVTKKEKLEFMFSLMQIIYADENVDEAEKIMFFKYLNELEFRDEIHDMLYNAILDAVKKDLKFEEYLTKNF